MRRELSRLIRVPPAQVAVLVNYPMVIAEIGFIILHPKLGSKWEEREMWKLLTPALTIAVLCLPAAAQTPVPQHGLKSGYIARNESDRQD
jgi:hypothetical protein